MVRQKIFEINVHSPVRFAWKTIDFEYEDRACRYIRHSQLSADVLRSHHLGTEDDRAKAFMTMCHVLSGLCWTTHMPFYTDSSIERGSYDGRKDVYTSKRSFMSDASYRKRIIHSHFMLPIAQSSNGWKALSYYREGKSASSSFHATSSFFKVVETAISDKRRRSQWIASRFSMCSGSEQPDNIKRLGGVEKFAGDVGHHAVSHNWWVADKIDEWTNGCVAARIMQNLAEFAIKDVLKINGMQVIKWKRS